ncbi:MAG: anti-sigma factor [Woeseiaceae bacterium]
MRITDLDTIDRLAAEYVLGTLTGAARRRFERWMNEDIAFRSAVYRWEKRLTGLAAEQTSASPPPQVWKRIQDSLFSADSVHAPIAAPRRLNWAAALFAGIAATFAVLYFNTTTAPQEAVASYTSVLQDNDKQPVWVIDAFEADKRLSLNNLAATSPPNDRVYQLWIVPADQSAPISLGVIDATRTQYALSTAQYEALATGAALAISIEPTGGSPTGAPTGPIPFVGSLSIG